MNTLLDGDLRLGEPVVRGPLTLFPIVGDAPAAPPYLAGPHAEALGALHVSEVDGAAAVPELVVHNTGAVPVLLVEGETVIGNKQNRTLNVSVLVAAGVATAVPVSCVEAGRWAAPQAPSRSSRHAPQWLRARKVQSVRDSMLGGRGVGGDQGQVWDDVAAYSTAFEVDAPSAALEDVYDVVAPTIEDLLAGLRPTASQRGVLVGLGGRPVALDLFDKSSTLADYWDGLLAGYALDALAARGGATVTIDAEGFLEQLREAPVVERAGAGLGSEAHVVHDRFAGVALRWEGAVVHLAAFAVDPQQPTRVSRPIVRRR
jgi:hypothetical protein